MYEQTFKTMKTNKKNEKAKQEGAWYLLYSDIFTHFPVIQNVNYYFVYLFTLLMIYVLYECTLSEHNSLNVFKNSGSKNSRLITYLKLNKARAINVRLLKSYLIVGNMKLCPRFLNSMAPGTWSFGV